MSHADFNAMIDTATCLALGFMLGGGAWLLCLLSYPAPVEPERKQDEPQESITASRP